MARLPDFMPRSDGNFNAWFINFCDRIIANPAAYGVSPDDLAELQTVYAEWQVVYPRHTTAQNTARAEAKAKDLSRNKSESVGRRLAKLIQSQKGTTDAQRLELDIRVRDTIRTSPSELVILTEQPPVIKAKCTESKTVRIDWFPSQIGTDSEALPKGIDGLAIWVAPGGIPADGSTWRFLAMDTNSPYIHNVKNDVTVTNAYKAQWFDKNKRMGLFCSPVIVAITP